MNKIIVAAPFGNYLNFQNATKTLGTYTLQKRAGFWTRLWRVATTVRYNWQTQSWVNRLGLPNPGITALKTAKDSILSVHGFNPFQWSELIRHAIHLEACAVELNLSCPNIDHRHHMLIDAIEGCRDHIGKIPIIAKLPPIRWMHFGKSLYNAGIRHFHLCNSMPTPGGGLSGKPLMQYSLWAIDDFRQHFGQHVTLIGGGGVTCIEDVEKYIRHGADHVSVGSMLFNPFNWHKIKKFQEVFVQ